PAGLGNRLGRSVVSGYEPMSPGRLRALNDLIGALPAGGGPRSAASDGADAPPGPDLGSSSTGSGSAARAASAGATGLTLGSTSASSGASGSPPPLGTSGLVFGSDPGSTSNSSSNASSKDDGSFEGPRFTSRIKDGPTKTIEVPFPFVVVCEP